MYRRPTLWTTPNWACSDSVSTVLTASCSRSANRSNRVYAVVWRITLSSVTRTLQVSSRLRYSQRCCSTIWTGALSLAVKVTWWTFPARSIGKPVRRNASWMAGV